jgi:hypothetical protein
MKKIKWANDPDWFGEYTRDQAKGAMPNGTRVRKVNSEAKDGHPDGSLATIIGSISAGPLGINGVTIRYLYFVEFDDLPHVGIGISEPRIEAINN